MPKSRRTFVRESPEQRRKDLIAATLEIIGESGFRSATVRSIAARANVTLGLIRHYFNTKEELISAAYEAHMAEMTRLALAPANDEDKPPKSRLIEVIRANLTAPVLSERNVTLWATFIAQIVNEPEIRATHTRTYLQFRDRFETLISQVLAAEGRAQADGEARQLATACNAIIDGLWMEGGASPVGVEGEDLAELALLNIGLILKLDLIEEGTRR